LHTDEKHKGDIPLKHIGFLQALEHEPADPIEYQLRLDDEKIALNELLGQSIELSFLDELQCIYCGRITKKFYGKNNSCYPCYRDLPENDLCIVKPELCHYHHGTCRDATFGELHCLQPHIVYLALSSDVKVGITRKTNMMKRWIDQGASQAMAIMEVPSRKDAGDIEIILAQYVKDKTNWRKMLKNEIANCDLLAIREDLITKLPEPYHAYLIPDPEIVPLTYPSLSTLEKITPLSLDKQATISGKLIGVKAQYLILDTGVFQVRKHAGYKVAFAV
jgi:hypothetical protein